MNPWWCASLISIFGGLGGVVNALLSDNGWTLLELSRKSASLEDIFRKLTTEDPAAAQKQAAVVAQAGN